MTKQMNLTYFPPDFLLGARYKNLSSPLRVTSFWALRLLVAPVP